MIYKRFVIRLGRVEIARAPDSANVKSRAVTRSLLWSATQLAGTGGLKLAGLILVAFAASAFTATPALLYAGPAATQPSTRDRQEAASLSRKAFDLIEKEKYADAETALRQSLVLEPGNPTRLYNLACVLAAQKKNDAAMDALEQATTAGFTDFTRLKSNEALAALHPMPRYEALLKRYDDIRHHAGELAVTSLRAKLGKNYRFEIDETNKLVYATNIDQATLDQLRKDLELQARSQWRQLFSHRSDEFIKVVVPSAVDFRRLVPSPHAGGIYDDTNRTAIVQHLGHFVTHEFTHALHAADQHALGQEHAVWVSEGLASLYETAEEEDGLLVPRDSPRLVPVRKAAKAHTLIKLEALLKMGREPFNAKPELSYGESAVLLQYLLDHDQLRKFYDSYSETYDTDPTGRIALERTTGSKLAALESVWTEWVLTRPDALATRANAGMLGVSLREITDGLRIVRLLLTGPAAKAGLRLDDVIVGIGEKQVRDRVALDPILASHQSGDELKVRIRRGTEYLELPVVLAPRPATRPTR